MATPPRIKIKTASTTKVYGRSSASLTIHIICVTYPSHFRAVLHLYWTQPHSGWLHRQNE